MAKHLAPCLRTIQTEPVSVGAGEILTFSGRGLPNLNPTGLRDVLAQPQGPLKDLQNLNLSGTKVAGSGLISLKGLSNLQELNLSRTGIVDEGLKGIDIHPELPLIGDPVPCAITALCMEQQALPIRETHDRSQHRYCCMERMLCIDPFTFLCGPYRLDQAVSGSRNDVRPGSSRRPAGGTNRR